MSTFWSLWIIVLTVITIIALTYLLFSNRTVDKTETDATTGHVYDGIEEYDNPLPSWWFNLFVVSILFTLVYLALYPGLGNFKGFLGWTSAGQHQQQVDVAEQAFNERVAVYMDKTAAQLGESPEALKMGKRLFKSHCSTCHGNDAKGTYAFPNLSDNDWLYGGDEATIKQTILHGRTAMMPAWGTVLGRNLDHVSDYVANLQELQKQGTDAQHPGAEHFKTYCSACHGADGKGNQALGAANLSDDIWLYGGTESKVRISIAKGRSGNMPAHKEILSEQQIHLITAYILSLGQ